MRHASHRSAPRRGGRAPNPSASRVGRSLQRARTDRARATRPTRWSTSDSDRQPTANPATGARSAPAPAQRYPTMATTRAQRGCQARSAPPPPTAACDRSNPALSCTATQTRSGQPSQRRSARTTTPQRPRGKSPGASCPARSGIREDTAWVGPSGRVRCWRGALRPLAQGSRLSVAPATTVPGSRPRDRAMVWSGDEARSLTASWR